MYVVILPTGNRDDSMAAHGTQLCIERPMLREGSTQAKTAFERKSHERAKDEIRRELCFVIAGTKTQMFQIDRRIQEGQ